MNGRLRTDETVTAHSTDLASGLASIGIGVLLSAVVIAGEIVGATVPIEVYALPATVLLLGGLLAFQGVRVT
ncbi:hypothetical protein [Saliphagus sp. LR7]|uniref:hypothetical protein n=1 Tax=Saliphagus sp. LR7 TaxID=2282654 RepID=UPI000DF7D023|nr:hypothetical protein [Saliphagus sp. LR7]